MLVAIAACIGLTASRASAQTEVGAGKTYTTLKAAFDAINAGTLTGDVVLRLTSSTTETATAVLNARTGSVTIYPTGSGYTISGNLNAPLIDLNGADNVTIDGRVNQAGAKNLTISNSSTGTSASTIRFRESAESNKVQFCTIKGASLNSSGGVIFFSTASSGNGNDGNTIDRNDITSDAAGRPINVIYSLGTSGFENSGNTISNNNIYNFLNAAAASNGINLGANTTTWTISGNSFYEAATFTASGTGTYTVISINNTSGNGFTVSGNYIGGSSASCSGTWTKTGSTNTFYGIRVSVGTTTASSIQGNTIKGFSWNNAAASTWYAMSIEAGNVNIGTTSGNTIGSSSSTSSIYYYAGGGNGGIGKVYGVYIASTGTIACSNNTIGSIQSEDGGSGVCSIWGIYKTGAGSTTISDNIIGSSSTANSIWAIQPLGEVNVANAIQGIYSEGTGTVTISGNTVANLNNDQSGSEGVALRVNGIVAASGTNTISGNTVSDLSTRNRNTLQDANSSVVGILLTGTDNANSVTGNTICRLSNARSSGSYSISIIGLYFSGSSSGNNVIAANFIHSLFFSAVATSYTYGIKIKAGSTTVYNNIIVIDNTSKTIIFGIFEPGISGITSKIYFNTVYIHGVPMSSTHNSYAFYCDGSSSTRDIRNNIFYNARTQKGTHYAIYIRTAGGALTINYNDYYTAETTLGYYGANITSFAAWKTATGQDANSLNVDPGFTNRGGVNVSDYHSSTSLLGISGTGVTTDYYGTSRATTPHMGAFDSYFRVWVGGTSTDFGTASNWSNGSVPPSGADIVFAAAPANDCVLDQDRIVGDISNAQSSKKLVINGKNLTINRNFNLTNGAQVDALAASSGVIFAGSMAQSIPSGAFTGNSVVGLTLNNSQGLTLNGDLTVSGGLTLTAGTLTIGAATLTLPGSNPPSRTSGSISAGGSGATLAFTNSAAVTLPASLISGSINNLTVNGAGITLGGDITVNGVLNLQSANPSATKGSLDMGAYTLTMGEPATTVGDGDVTGTVKRTSFQPNVPYSFGHRNSGMGIGAGGVMPTEVTFKIAIGEAPSWKTDAVKRSYEINQLNGGNTQALVQLYYLDSELNGNTESKLVTWDYHADIPKVEEHGKAIQDSTANWVVISNRELNYFVGRPWGVANKSAADYVWQGSYSSDWNNNSNWSGGNVPTSTSDVIIPNASTTANDPILPATASVKRITIQSGGIVDGRSSTTFTVTGGGGAWNCAGTFIPGTSTVLFDLTNASSGASATIGGSTTFYNIAITSGGSVAVENNNYMSIAGAITLGTDAILRAAYLPNTIEYNGTSQTVIYPNGLTPGYWNLTLSGSSTKTMPTQDMSIYGNFTLSGTASAAAGGALDIGGNTTIGANASFTTGAFSHSIGGNFTNNGTLTATGSTIALDGASAQTVGGSSATTFENVHIQNAEGVTLASSALTTVTGTLQVESGKLLKVAPGVLLTVTGTVINNGGNDGFVLQSDATGTSSILHNTDNVPAIVRRYIPGGKEAWHFLSPPVKYQTFTGEWFPMGTYGNGTGYDLYVWHEPTNCWIYFLNYTGTVSWPMVHPEVTGVLGRGYLYSLQNQENFTHDFIGVLGNGAISCPLTVSSTNISLAGFNFVGNSYPSAIDWCAATGWTRGDLVASGSGYDVWIWNPNVNNYGVYNSGDADGVGTNSVGRYIASCQGFFVKANQTGNLVMTNDVRVHNASATLLKAKVQKRDVVSLTVKSEAGLGVDEVMLRFGHPQNASGATKLFSRVETAPSLYLSTGKENLSIRYLTTPEQNASVPVMFTAGASGTYTISSAFDLLRFSLLKLEDRQTHYIHDLSTGRPYQFRASKGDSPNRFVLHFAPVQPDSKVQMPAQVYAYDRKLVVDLELVGGETDVEVYDLLGRKVMQRKVPGEVKHSLDLDAKTGLVVVVLRNRGSALSQKIMWVRE